MNTGENLQSLRRIHDWMLRVGFVLLLLHFYMSCYNLFKVLHWTHPFLFRIFNRRFFIDFFIGQYKPRIWPLVLLIVAQLAIRGRKNEKLRAGWVMGLIISGLCLYFINGNFLMGWMGMFNAECVYIALSLLGYWLMMIGMAKVSRIIWSKIGRDVFNQLNESFPQQEQLVDNPYSINLPALYKLRGKTRPCWINIINPFRGILVAGSPGSGKSYFVIRHIISQHIRKGLTMFVYDFKFDDLSKIAYNAFLRNKGKYPVVPKFYVIDFDHLNVSSRCNPLDPDLMTDITDALEAARTIMLGLNREWIQKQGEFFVESPINFLTAIIWFLKKYARGRYCTLPHVMELMNEEYEKLFSVLKTEPEISVLINPFVSAFVNGAVKQLEGQIGSAKIALARLSSPRMYYVLSGNDFSLDINNPEEPKIVCIGNNPMKLSVYGAVLSLFAARMVKLVNRRGQLPSSLIFDEFPTIYFNGMDSLMATGRSNLVSCTICVQDFSQLQRDYGKSQADVITGIAGNIISGQVVGETARLLSDRFGRIQQDRSSVSVNSSDRSITQSFQLDAAVPAAKISRLSSGEMVGIIADTPDQPIELKGFHAKIQIDRQMIEREEAGFVPIPEIRKVSEADIERSFLQIQTEVHQIVESIWIKMSESTEQASLLVKKKGMIDI